MLQNTTNCDDQTTNSLALKNILTLILDENEQHNRYVFFYEHIGDDLYTLDHLKKQMDDRTKSAKIFLVIDDSYEGVLTQDDVQNIMDNIVNKHSLDCIICSSNEKLVGEKVFFYSYHLDYKNFDNIDVQKDVFSPNLKPRNKIFLSLNRHTRFHRLELVDYLIEKDLLDHSYISCNRSYFEKYASKEITDINITQDRIIKRGYFDQNILQHKLSQASIDRLDKHLPFVLDINELGAHMQIFSAHMPNVERFFQDSYWSLIGERDFYDDRYRGWTEKVLKSLFYCHPFIIIGLPHTLKSLRSLGFITFGGFIDESYDEIEDHSVRFNKIKKQIDYLASLNYVEHYNLYRKMLPILKYNRNHYINLNKTYQPTMLANELLRWYVASYKEDYNH